MGRPPKAATTGKACATKYGGSRNRAISGKDATSSIPSPLTGEGEGGGERETQGTERRPEPAPPIPTFPRQGGRRTKGIFILRNRLSKVYAWFGIAHDEI